MALEIGPNAQLNVEEEPRLDLELAQTLLLQTGELTVLERAVRPVNVTLKDAQVRSLGMIVSKPKEHNFLMTA